MIESTGGLLAAACGAERTHLVVALLQGLLRKAFPAFGPVDALRCLQCDVKIATFNREIEACVFVLDEVQRDLPTS